MEALLISLKLHEGYKFNFAKYMALLLDLVQGYLLSTGTSNGCAHGTQCGRER